jgi:hypothetical protein
VTFIPNKTCWKTSGIVFCALLLAVIVLTAFGFGRHAANLAPITRDELVNHASSAIVFQGDSSASGVGAEHITLRRTGFEPNDITRPAGRFLLAVDNVTGMGQMSFRLLRETGNAVLDMPSKPNKFRLRQIIDLPPGRYFLVEVDHPEWVCRFTITRL